MEGDNRWDEYFQETMKYPPSETARKALQQFGSFTGKVIDLGCGAGKDCVFFLKNGWKVVALDWNTDYICQIWKTLPGEMQKRLEIQKGQFEKLELGGEYDCVLANFSLPFCRPAYFPDMWRKVMGSIRPGGIFSGVFFGDRDGWAQDCYGEKTFHSREQLLELLESFQIIDLDEREYEGSCYGEDGKPMQKHWHIFQVVVRK